MARAEDMDMWRMIDEQKTTALKAEAIAKYGENLGVVFSNYVLGNINSQTFAAVIVSYLESGLHEQKVMAVTALLDSTKEQIETACPSD